MARNWSPLMSCLCHAHSPGNMPSSSSIRPPLAFGDSLNSYEPEVGIFVSCLLSRSGHKATRSADTASSCSPASERSRSFGLPLILQDDVIFVLEHRLVVANLLYRDRLKHVPLP